MNAYAEEVGGEGEHRYILMCLVALEDPGLTIFPTHRLVKGLDEPRRAALREALERDFEITEVPRSELAPTPREEPTPLEMGYIDGRDERCLRLALKDQAIADAALAGHSEPYRHLDTGVLETLLLKNALGLSDDDIAHFNGMFYARDTEEAVAMVRSGEYDAAFVMRPTPVAPGPRAGGRGREHAAEVDLLLSEAPDGAAVQPTGLKGSPPTPICEWG